MSCLMTYSEVTYNFNFLILAVCDQFPGIVIKWKVPARLQ